MVLQLVQHALTNIFRRSSKGRIIRHTRNIRQVGVAVDSSSKKRKVDATTPTKIEEHYSVTSNSSSSRSLSRRSLSLSSLSSDLLPSSPRSEPIPIKPSKKKYEVAIVACGSFWSPQDRLKRSYGIKNVVVGYIGGQQQNPTLHDMRDHTQALLVEYNPKKISYVDLLQLWNDNDDPWQFPTPEEDDAGDDDCRVSSQSVHSRKCVHSRSALFVIDQQQEEQAVEYVAELALTRPTDELHVDIIHVNPSSVGSTVSDNKESKETTLASSAHLPPLVFHKAEDYQQDYIAKQREMAREQIELWKLNLCSSGLYPILE